MHGILNLNKPSNMSSAQAVARVKKILPRGTKIGHAGTLDPFATGVLLLLIGQATKLCECLMDQSKQYEATVHFGFTTATDDSETPQVPWPTMRPRPGSDSPPVISAEVDAILLRFTGQALQLPPTFSALKVGGRRAYKLARAGESPVLKPRPVMIYELQRLGYNWPLLRLRVDCGRGTYIRALARDIGAALDVGGHLTQLCRTRIGPFRLDSACSLENINNDSLQHQIIPLDRAVDMIKT